MSPTNAASFREPAAVPQITATRVMSGRVRPKARDHGPRRYFPGAWSATTLPVNAFLVEHPAGPVLFDTGQTARATRRGHIPRWHPFLRLARFELSPGDEVAAQLSRRGRSAHAVRIVVLSHLHTDHVGTVGSFPGADVLVARTEWERATGVAGALRGYLPQHWPRALRPTLVDFGGPPRGPFAATHDLLGDRTLLLVPLAGHTPGHLGMLVDVEPRMLLVGDLVHDPRQMTVAAPEIAAFCAAEHVAVLSAHDERPPIPARALGHDNEGDG